MSRTARLDIPNQYYHITNRGERKEPLFIKQEDYLVFLKYLTDLLIETDVLLFAFCLMPNHFHLLILRQIYLMAKFMQRLESRFGKSFNKHNNLIGHVFQERYHSSIILDECYLMNVVYYIHNNPVKGILVEKEEDYKYSSAGFYHGNKSKLPLQRIPIFKGKQGIQNYLQFLGEESSVKFPIYRDSIGLKEQYDKIDKRKGRIENFFIENREKLKDIDSCYDFIVEKYLYDKCICNRKTKERFNDNEKKIIMELLKFGFSQAEIARKLKCHKSTINKILIRNRKKRCSETY